MRNTYRSTIVTGLMTLILLLSSGFGNISVASPQNADKHAMNQAADSLLKKGSESANAGDWAGAVVHFEAALETVADKSLVYRQIIDSAFLSHLPEEMEKWVESSYVWHIGARQLHTAEFLWLFDKLSKSLGQQNKTVELERFYKDIQLLAQSLEGTQNIQSEAALGLADLLVGEQRREEALPVLQQILTLFAFDKIPASNRIFDALVLKAEILYFQSRYAEAGSSYLMAESLMQRLKTISNTEKSHLLVNYARTLDKLDKLTEAQRLLKANLVLQIKSKGEITLEAADAARVLGNNLHKQGLFEVEKNYLGMAVAIYQKLGGDMDEKTLATSLELSWAYYELKTYDKALDHVYWALSGYEADLNKYWFEAGYAWELAALVNSNMGQIHVAEAILRTAVEHLGKHPQKAGLLLAAQQMKIAVILYRTNRKKEADTFYGDAQSLATAIYGADHKITKAFIQARKTGTYADLSSN